jgi:hypothetical protein
MITHIELSALLYATALTFLVIGIVLTQVNEIKQNYRKQKDIKRYKRLMQGIPKRVVALNHWGDIWRYRKYPLYINGKVLGIHSFYVWHINDDRQRLIGSDGKTAGYLVKQIVSSKRKTSGTWKHSWGIAIAKKHNTLGDIVQPSAVVDVY